MGAGKPNWDRLAAIGKLPVGARSNIPALAKIDALESRIKELEEENAKLKSESNDSDEAISVKCEVEGCDFVAEGKSEGTAKNYLRLHMRSHEKDNKNEN